MSFIFPIASHFLFEFVFDCLVKIGKMTQNETAEASLSYLLQWTAWESKRV